MATKIQTILLIFIMIIGFILRIYGINWGLPTKDYYFSYHSDEVHYIRGLSQMNPAKFDFNPRFFNWGSWHYYELGSVIGLAGILNFVTLSKDKYFYYAHPWEMAKIYLVGRFLSVFFALATIFLVYLIAKNIYNANLGLLAAFFLAINPAHTVNSHYLKADASVTFWITILLFSCMRLLDTGRLRWYIFSGVFFAMAVGSQYNGICFAHTILFAHLLREYRIGGSPKIALFSKRLWLGYLTALITYLIINPCSWLSTQEFITGMRNILLRHSGSMIATIERTNILLDTIKIFNVSLSPFFVVLAVAGIIYGITSSRRKVLLVTIWLMPYLLFMIITGALETRFHILIFPGLFILIVGLIQLFYSKNKKLKYTIILYVVIASLYTIIYSYAYDKELARKTIQDEASEWLIIHVPAQTRIGIANTPEIRRCPTIIHQDYYYKSGATYHIINLNNDVAYLKQEKPQYIVISKNESFNDRDASVLMVPDFINEIKENYSVVKVFEREPSFLCFSFKNRTSIGDWSMLFPVIYILKKRP